MQLVDVAEGFEHEQVNSAFGQGSICSRKASRASAKEVLPSGSIRMPSGPTDPATHTSKLLAASRATLAPARLISRTLSARLWRARRNEFPPKVLVSMISAPACRYS